MRGAHSDAPIWFMAPTSTFLVDDSPSFLQSAARFLSSDERIEIVGMALSAQEALDEVERLQPALVLMDLTMPGMSGLEATRRLKASPHPPHVIILTLHDTEEYRQAAEQAHADGFVSKSDFGQKLLPLLEPFLAQECSASAQASAQRASTQRALVQPAAIAAGASSSTSSTYAPLLVSHAPQSAQREVVAPRSQPVAPPLPQTRDLGALPLEAGRDSLEKRRVLLAQDQPAVSHLMALNMWRAGIETRIAVDARSALELSESFEPHLILLDATSQHMNATAMCRSIRSHSNVPILLLTSAHKSDDSASSLPSAALSAVALSEWINVEEMLSRPEEAHLLTAHVLTLLRRFYTGAA